MDPRFVNLYGVRPEERRNDVPQSGSCFIGRLLISLHMVENDNPKCMVEFN